jgi:hypothetical protein
MDTSTFSHDVLTAAEAQVARTKWELETACEQTKSAGKLKRSEWLAEQSELAECDRLIEDLPRRQAQYKLTAYQFQSVCHERIRELSRNWGFNAPTELEDEILFYRDLFNKLLTDKPVVTPQSWIDDPRLDLSHKEALKRLIDAQEKLVEAKSAQRRQSEIDQLVISRIEEFVIEQTSAQQVAYDDAIRASEEARRECISQFRLRLEYDGLMVQIEDFIPSTDHPLRQQLEVIKKNYLRDVRESQECDWWRRVAAHPIASVIERLSEVPNEHIETVLALLLKLPATDPNVLNEKVYGFLQQQKHRLARLSDIAAPVVIAHIGQLIGNDDYESAGDLLNRFPKDDRSELEGLVAYLRYVISEPIELSGTTDYWSLSEEDLFLGACYYGSGVALSTLKKQLRWDYPSLERALLNAKNGSDAHLLHSFKAGGLQPRIAELAFRRVYGRLHGADAENKLRDLNAESVQMLSPPWSLHSRPRLPGSDWEDADGRQYDVKSNPFYHSLQKQIGLRGFLIELSRNQADSFPGFVFTETTEESCSWTYVGEYQRIEVIKQEGNRILPFCFRLPDRIRYVRTITKPIFDLGIRLLKDPWLRIGWQLAAQMRSVPRQEQRTSSESLLDECVEQCLQSCRGAFLEYALWEALTKTTLYACSQHGSDSAGTFLDLTDHLIASRALPIRLPRIGDKPVLSSWINQVLKPLNEHWYRIQCSICGCRATEPGMIQLRITGMTSEGTIYGRMTCNQCGYVRNEATLLTHCYNCKCYPLIIGKNTVCRDCKRLKCQNCECCKMGCGKQRHTPETDFLDIPE